MAATEPNLEHRDEQPHVGAPVEVSLSEWGEVNALVGGLLGWLEERDGPLAGTPLYEYDVVGDENAPFSMEVGVPTEDRLAGDERVRPGTVPSGTYAVTIHEDILTNRNTHTQSARSGPPNRATN